MNTADEGNIPHAISLGAKLLGEKVVETMTLSELLDRYIPPGQKLIS